MAENPLVELERLGQSIWLDFISKDLIESGELQNLIKNDRLKGLTSNPSIFEKAIAQTDHYDQLIAKLSLKDSDVKSIYENVAIADIKAAADLFRPVYEESKGQDGFVSLEVSPHLAFDPDKTLEEAKRLWYQVERPNLMIKVPGTKKCMPVIRELIFLGINVNITLLFSEEAYKECANAYLQGLNDRATKGLPINSVQSVASFFVSRIDTKIDQMLEKIISENDSKKDLAKKLLGQIAIANARLAFKESQEIFSSELAKTLLKRGANPQKLLWASTGTKNPKFSDVLYVESLIAQNTVNTLPPATLEAFRDHGKASITIKNDLAFAEQALLDLEKLGIDFKACCDELIIEGLKIFTDSFDKLLNAVSHKLEKLSKNKPLKKN